MATLVAAMDLPPALCILPNLETHSINFPHDRDTAGTCIQNKAVRTIIRVGLQAVALPAAPMHVTMSFHTAANKGREITADAVKRLGHSIYCNLASTSLQLRNHAVLPAAESDGGAARGACVAEATFLFKFGVTAEQIPGLSRETPVWLRFTVDGSPHLFVDTPLFRLMARNCPNRNPKAKKLVLATQKLITQVPSRARGAIVLALALTHPSQNHSSNLHPDPNPNPNPPPNQASASLIKMVLLPVDQQIRSQCLECAAPPSPNPPHMIMAWTICTPCSVQASFREGSGIV